MKIIYSIIVLTIISALSFIYFKEKNYDPNVFDAVLNVRVSDDESNDFDFGTDIKIDSFTKEIISYIERSDMLLSGREVKIKAEGKKPLKFYFSQKSKFVSSGVYSIKKTGEKFLVFYNGDIEDSTEKETLQEAVSYCIAGSWNTMGTELVYIH